ncbi:MAG: hypothetical protein JAZ17_14950 [Candidatus Thiodiazotropha endolucinida]|nr:hypothetical protein [Candidatus Thiodiazotropha endolucinida]
MKRIFLVLLPILFSLQACQTNPSINSLTSEQRAQVVNMDLYKSDVSKPREVLGPVKGLSCQRNAYARHIVSEEEAIEGVKIRAAQLNADAVINILCQKNTSTDWENNCWSSVVCIGDAIKYSKDTD